MSEKRRVEAPEGITHSAPLLSMRCIPPAIPSVIGVSVLSKCRGTRGEKGERVPVEDMLCVLPPEDCFKFRCSVRFWSAGLLVSCDELTLQTEM